MSSRAFSQAALLIPETSLEEAIIEYSISNYRHPTVYDAVAGRISAAGFIPKRPVISKTRDTASSSASAIPPENVLFRSKNAPTRYAEADIYFANERQSVKNLPESDVLKALHCYTSDFYSHAPRDGGAGDWRSLDETALLALGILIEEAGRDILGTTGDLAFTEGEETVELRRQQISVRRSKSKDRPSKKRRVASID